MLRHAKCLTPSRSFQGYFVPVWVLSKHEARTAPTAQAIQKFHRARPVPYALQEKVNQELDRMLRERVIRPVEKRDWATPVVVI